MAWTCINCETHNAETQHLCEVCGCERLFTIEEVQKILERTPESNATLEQELKKLSANYKRSQTNQRKLAEERKQAIQRMEELEKNKKFLLEQIAVLQAKIRKEQQANFRSKIILLFLATLALLLMFTRVAIEFRFY